MNRYTLLTVFSFLIIGLLLPLYAWREPARMAAAQDSLRQEFVGDAALLYVENCAVCHGAQGEGLGATPPLDSDVLRAADYDFLYKIIARGLYGTAMPGWHQEEGGVFNDYQIDELVALIRYADWGEVNEIAASRGLIPASLPVPEVDEAFLEEVAALDPQGAEWAHGMQLYATNCTTCHGVNGEGTELAVALNTPEVQGTDAAELVRLIKEGVPGTLMVGWDSVLAGDEVAALVAFLQNWERIGEEGLVLTPPEPIRVDVDDPEAMLALGERIFSTTCSACHGENGSGGQGPALNSQQVLTSRSDAQIRDAIVNGGHRPFSQMPAFGERMTSVEIDALVQFIRAWEPTAPMVENPRGTAQGGGPPWLRATPDAANPVSPGQGAGAGQGAGGGRGTGGGQGQGQGGPPWRQQDTAGSGNATQGQGAAPAGQPQTTVPFSGEVVSVEGNLLTFRDGTGALVDAMLGPPWFWSENGIPLAPGERIRGEGFEGTDPASGQPSGHTEVNWLTNETSGQTVQLRTPEGMPVWATSGQ